MESRNQLTEIDIKNRTCYYFGDIMKDRGVNSGNILLSEKIYELKYFNL